MLNVILFTCRRPMQCHAYLESLFHWTTVKPHQVTVLAKEHTDLYEQLAGDFPDVDWHWEEQKFGFREALYANVMTLPNDDHLMFGADDVVWTGNRDVNNLCDVVKGGSILGFSNRLGTNLDQMPFIMPTPPYKEGFIEVWNWRKAYRATWGYPFELESTIYRVTLVREILDWAKASSEPMVVPNHLERAGEIYCRQHLQDYELLTCMVSPGATVCQDVNRVQDVVKNKHKGGPAQDPNILIDLYRQGYRLNWRKASGSDVPTMQTGLTHWELIEP